ncbi:alpha/beta fold hydrolase [Salinicola halophilus]|uniref:alpha/beta fold hydrolase n=1 Tax=Salinicola halophilus TaxID=184065 RepID=UPI000DA1ED5E|nr:alpha/beta hydrolase [Salinicola halophilus]
MPTLRVDNATSEAVDIHYLDAGERNARPVVLIHGWPLSHRMWEHQIAALTEAGYRVIAYDRRGFGASSQPWTGYDYDTLADDLDGLMTGLALRDAVLLGFSMGGGEVARYLGRHGSDRVAAALFVAAVPPYLLKGEDNPDGVDASVFEEMKSGVKQDRVGFLTDFGRQFVNHGDDAPTVSQAVLSYCHTIASFASPKGTLDCITAFAETDFRGDLDRIDVPTLVIHGDADGIVPLEVSGQRTHDRVEGSRLEVVSGAPHGLNFTHPDELNRLMLEFIGSL